MTKPLETIHAPQTITASIETTIKVLVRLAPGAWIMGSWSIVQIQFEVYRDTKSGLWFTHVSYPNFRAVRRPDNYRGRSEQIWARTPIYPGFQPRIEHIPQMVLDTLRATYEQYGVSPEFLPPPDVSKGRGPAR